MGIYSDTLEPQFKGNRILKKTKGSLTGLPLFNSSDIPSPGGFIDYSQLGQCLFLNVITFFFRGPDQLQDPAAYIIPQSFGFPLENIF